MLRRAGRTSLAALVLFVAIVVVPDRPAHALGPVVVLTHPSTPAFAPSWADTTSKQNAPDPDVVRFGSTYYAYTTGTTWGNHIGILRSSSPDHGYTSLT